ncbi:unnamed protein product, partial [Sphagnum balticum]
MGPRESKVEETKVEEEGEVPKIYHPKFRNRELVRQGNGDETIKIAVPVASEKEYILWRDQMAKIPPHEAIFLPKSHKFNKEGFCGSSGSVEESNTDLELAETFSIGLSCLDAATLSDSIDLYLPNRKFDYPRLEKRLKELDEREYSQ